MNAHQTEVFHTRRLACYRAELVLLKAEDQAHAARQALTKLEVQAAEVRERGGTMGAPFWVTFGNAKADVLTIERAVCEARAQLETARKGR